MVPAHGWAATTTSTTGSADLDNTFYNLPSNITFTIYGAKMYDDKTVANVVTNKELVENVKFIDSKNYHKMVAAVNFGKISTATVDKDGNKLDYTLDVKQDLQVKFACWEAANTYSWTSKAPEIKWNAEGKYDNIQLATQVSVKNSYDSDRFNGTFDNLIGTNKYLTIVPGSAHFYYGTQEDPYFKPVVAANGTVSISGTQTEAAPTVDHEEKLSFKVKDCYGHEKTLSLSVTVKRPEKK